MIPTLNMLDRSGIQPFWKFWNRTPAKVVQKFGAVCIVGAVGFRRDCGSKNATSYPGAYVNTPTTPPDEFIPGVHLFRVGTESSPIPCTTCRNGMIECGGCHGARQVPDYYDGQATYSSCQSCSGRGKLICPVCRGAEQTVQIDIGSVSDVVVNISDSFLPTAESNRFELAITQALDSVAGGWSKEQRVPLLDHHSPYGRGVVQEDFQGFDYTDAMNLAQKFLANVMSGRKLMSDPPVAYAVPIIVAKHGNILAAHFCARNELVTVTETRTIHVPL